VRLHYHFRREDRFGPQPEPPSDTRGELAGTFAGLTEVLIPAGYVQTGLRSRLRIERPIKAIYSTTTTSLQLFRRPVCPSPWSSGGAGKEDIFWKMLGYEAASKRRISPA